MSKQKVLHTKFGNAKINSRGYYLISSGKEGNFGKLLHRLIWEDFYGCKIPKGYVIHHKNGLKTDNCILNLQLINATDHLSLHKSEENHHFYNVPCSNEIKQSISKTMTSTGIKNVYKQKDKAYTLGYAWVYQYYKNKKRSRLSSVDLLKLKQKVIKNGLPWLIVDANKAKQSFEENEKGKYLNSQ